MEKKKLEKKKRFARGERKNLTELMVASILNNDTNTAKRTAKKIGVTEKKLMQLTKGEKALPLKIQIAGLNYKEIGRASCRERV